MTASQLVAQAVASWLASRLSNEADLVREALPLLDVDWLFKALKVEPAFDPGAHSLALAGFGMSEVDIQQKATAAGLAAFRGLSDDLHVAASWRNDRTNHSSIIALARGWHPGVSTLSHFGVAHSRDLAVQLLAWAETKSGLAVNERQKELLQALQQPQAAELASLDSVSAFLAAWFDAKASDALDAPRVALSRLGLLADPALFEKPGTVGERLIKNFATVQRIKDAPAANLRTVQRNLNKRFVCDLATRDRLLGVCDKLRQIRLSPSPDNLAEVTITDALEVWKPPKDAKPEPLPDPVAPEDLPDLPEEPDDTGTQDLREIAVTTGEDLLDNKQDRLTARLEGLESALQSALAENQKAVDTEIEVDGDAVAIEFPIDQDLLGWLNTYCAMDAWGGLLHTKEPVLKAALKQHETVTHWSVTVNRIAVLDDRALSMRQVLGDWEAQLGRRGHETQLVHDWDRFVADRAALIESLHALFHFPLDWLAGRPEKVQLVERYLSTATSLYRQVQEHFRVMHEVDQGWAEIALHGLLALDVMQVRCEHEDGRHSWKAVLLPTHPLHLWRYQRLASVLRGLGPALSPEDRLAVLDECRRPEQFLSVLFISSLPESKGGSRLLPISSDLHGLATFENLQNACSGLDGIQAVRYALDRFCVIHRKHLTPLRVGFVNPPDATRLLAEVSKLLAERRVQTLPAMRVELFSTIAPAVRARAARALDFASAEQDLLEARLTSGRLQLRVHEKPRSLEEWVQHWREEPLHVLVIFDEAGVSIRRSDMGVPLPMSPFCVRKIIRYQELRGTLRLDPTTDEPPFSEFMQLVNEADKGQRDSTPNAWADAENLRSVADEILQGDEPSALWLAVSDRALPPESGLRSARLLVRREEQREVLLLARDYHRLTDLVRPAFNQWNLHVSAVQLERLLEEGVHLAGAGLLDLIKKDGSVDNNRVLGLAGTLLAARGYRNRHPDALIVSVEHQISRHWLRLGKRNERCDLLCLRKEGDKFVLEGIEVKSTQGNAALVKPDILDQARQQLEATLEAVADGLAGADSPAGALAAPRCEMLKEVLVRGCLSKSVPPEKRGAWSQWLKQIFRQEGDPVEIQVIGQIIRVALGEGATIPDIVLCDDPFAVTVRTLEEATVQRLIEAPVQQTPITVMTKPNVAPSPRVGPMSGSRVDAHSWAPGQSDRAASREALETALSATEIQQASESGREPEADSNWPPQVNELGMIGQNEIVRQLINRIHYARDFRQPFKDTMFVGSAGVGKSSFARAIAEQLLGESPILFNGADLRQPRMIVERLQQADNLPDVGDGQVIIEPCLLFIDEVHALSPSVVNILLSALDDRRVTTIDNRDYDFRNVIILMATTDAGKLTEAFRSRPDRVLLRNYTLDELAGILWLHGRQELDGYALPREVCLEIGARTRALPRVAVRTLTNQLIPHFYAIIREASTAPDRARIGEAMTAEAVAVYFEEQGIDINGLDSIAKNYLRYLSQHGATAEERIRQGLGISNRADFTEVDEYLQRLGLVVVRGGRALTPEGRRYLNQPVSLRHRISRQQ